MPSLQCGIVEVEPGSKVSDLEPPKNIQRLLTLIKAESILSNTDPTKSYSIRTSTSKSCIERTNCSARWSAHACNV